MNPYATPGLLSKGLGITKSINWATFLDGTQKTLGVINQAIPIVYQVKPIIGNAKTLFKIANVMNEAPTSSVTPQNQIVQATSSINSASPETQKRNSPIFYI